MQDKKFNWSDPTGEEMIAFEPQIKFLRDSGRQDQAEYVANLDGTHHEHREETVERYKNEL
jgi:hypothetical protein